MAWPTWMPLAARPSNWPDWSDILRQTTPKDWPKRLFGLDTEAWRDLVSFGESLALARDIVEIMLRRIWPARDDDATFLDQWEASFDIQPEATTAKRQDRLISALRLRGTMTQDLVKSIMCRAWGSDDPDIVSLLSPTQGWTADSDKSGAQLGHNMHIYHTNLGTEPDAGIIEDLIAKAKPTWESWTYGAYATLVYGTPGEKGTWDHACWG